MVLGQDLEVGRINRKPIDPKQTRNIFLVKSMDMQQIMQQAQHFQENMGKLQEELGKKKVSSTVGGGMVSATVNGKQELLSLTIEKEVIDPNDPTMLQDLVVAAVNEALRRAKSEAQAEMSKLTGGMSIPGLF